ncbi:MAG: glycogen debranching N-terminal domain-containing protein [Candidatus Binataceae bacterium]
MKRPRPSGRLASRSGRRPSLPKPAETVLKVGSAFYVLASSLASRRVTRVLADGHSFAIFDAGGDIVESPLEALGLFHRDTRYLSRFELRIAGQTPYFLNSFLSDDKAQLRVNLTNPDLGDHGGIIDLPRNSIQLQRSWTLGPATLFHRMVVRNYTQAPVALELEFRFGVDFADLFEVRGIKRLRHGATLPPERRKDRIKFLYRGLDRGLRFSDLTFKPAPTLLDAAHAAWSLKLAAESAITLELRIRCGNLADRGFEPLRPKNLPRLDSSVNFDRALQLRRAEIVHTEAGWAKVTAGNEMMNSLFRHSECDLMSIMSQDAAGTYIMAGIPWFATLFGRDSIITALSMLPFSPAVAAGTLRMLARFQGAEVNADRDEQPGKIVHELRFGEMAVLHEVPFGRYYGSVDSTPLFLWLFGSYVAATGDLKLAAQLWPHVERALAWIDQYGDPDGDGYVEYLRETPQGLANQGWKDSFDSISHADGSLARPPIALCEVQGYLYAAFTTVAEAAARMNRNAIASRLSDRAKALKAAFTRDFWLDDEGTVALALDGDKKPCRVIASNAAHCLATGLLDRDRSAVLATRLMADDMFSGWGVRTLSTNARRYNPMSYHNGSVWPHDNAIAALGLARIPGRDGALAIMRGMFDAAIDLRGGSLPELFCGFPREARLGPVPYPVACHPQAWAAASVMMMLQAILGLHIDGFDGRLVIDSPVLPDGLGALSIAGMRVGAGAASFIVRGSSKGATVEITEKRGPISIEVKS